MKLEKAMNPKGSLRSPLGVELLLHQIRQSSGAIAETIDGAIDAV